MYDIIILRAEDATPAAALAVGRDGRFIPLTEVTLRRLGARQDVSGPVPGRVAAANRGVAKRPERRLVAIMAADAVNYSRQMNRDETGALQRLVDCRTLMATLIGDHGGHIANRAGDSVLAAFTSVLDAVQCAMAIQARLADADADSGEDGRMRFRIGVHVAEVMLHEGDLFGDGVNVAARLESIADPDGICLSAQAYHHVRKLLPVDFEDLGPHQFKNIEEPVRVFAHPVRSTAPVALIAASAQPDGRHGQATA